MVLQKEPVTSTDNGAPRFRVVGSNNFEMKTHSVWGLYMMYKDGQIKFVSPWLQRMIQELAWMENDRAGSFIHSFFTGNAKVDTFAFVYIKVVLDALDDRLVRLGDNDQVLKECLANVIQKVQDDLDMGGMVYCLDGQNRLDRAIRPFFDNKLEISAKHPVHIQYDIGGPLDLSGKTFAELEPDVQEYLKGIQVPTVWATSGDLSSIITTLVNKNDGEPWSAWERLFTDKFFSVHMQQNLLPVLSFTDTGKAKEDMKELLDSVANMSSYPSQKWGYEKFINELFVWMSIGKLPPANLVTGKESFHEKMFNGDTPPAKYGKMIGKYLKEFHQSIHPTVRKKKKIPLTELQNYVLFRFLIDEKLKAQGFDVDIKIELSKQFTVWYRNLNDKLSENDDLNWFKDIHPITKKEIKSYKPGGFLLANRLKDQAGIQRRMFHLFAGLKNDWDFLISQNIIRVIDNSALKSGRRLAVENDFKDMYGQELSPDDKYLYDRGHRTPKTKSGSAADAALQDRQNNRRDKDNVTHIG